MRTTDDRGRAQLIGRTAEVRRLQATLAQHRFVTLTGTGGIGKTSLALELARRSERSFEHRVWVIGLDAISAPELIGPLICEVVGIGVGSGDPLEAFAAFLGDRSALLLVDNCEHLVDAAAGAVDELLRTCPRLRVLATSRQSLGAPNEFTVAVPPLAVEARTSGDDAVELFLARARAVRPGYAPTDDEREVVREICRRLDGLPLAIELAAARAVVLSARDTLSRLDQPFSLLKVGTTTVPARHRALEASLQWSFELCTPNEQRAWRYLSTFDGPFTLEAAEALLLADGETGHATDCIQSLAEKAILETDVSSGSVVFRMLEATRYFGRNQVSGDELANLNTRLFDYVVAFSHAAAAHATSPEQTEWTRKARTEIHTIRQALALGLGWPARRPDLIVILVLCYRAVWWANGWIRELIYWNSRVVQAEAAPSAVRGYALSTVGAASSVLGVDTSEENFAEARQIADALHDHELRQYVNLCSALASLLRGDFTSALRQAEQGVAETAHPTLGSAHLDFMQIAADAADASGRGARAVELAHEIIRIVEPLGESWYHSLALRLLAVNAWREGDLREALDRALEALRLSREQNGEAALAAALQIVAFIRAEVGDDIRAATLLGFVDFNRHANLAADSIYARTKEVQRIRESLRERLGVEAYARAFDAGAAASHDDVVRYALEHSAELRVRTPRSKPHSGIDDLFLTPRELEIAELVGAGWSNKQIATKLFISRRTVEGHVDRIRGKLGLASRTQIASRLTEHANLRMLSA